MLGFHPGSRRPFFWDQEVHRLATMTASAVSTLAVGLPLSWTSIAGNVEPFTAWVALPEVKLPLYFAFNDPVSPPRHDEAGRPCGGLN